MSTSNQKLPSLYWLILTGIASKTRWSFTNDHPSTTIFNQAKMRNEFSPSLTQTEEGLSRDGEESEDCSEIYQAFGLHPEDSEDAAGDTYYTRRLYNNDGDNGNKLYNKDRATAVKGLDNKAGVKNSTRKRKNGQEWR